MALVLQARTVVPVVVCLLAITRYIITLHEVLVLLAGFGQGMVTIA